MSSHEAASGHQRKVGARYTLAPGAVSAEFSGSSQHADHRYGTPYARHSYAVVHERASSLSASPLPFRKREEDESK
jgi:hypothetical protein